MKSVLISIRPEWCNKIASGKKTIEVRKTRPKCETPFKCYIYCTKAKRIGFDEFYADPLIADLPFGDCGNEKVIGEFICDRIITVDCDSVAPFDRKTEEYIDKETCLDRDALWEYTHGRCAYGWHISDLKIYDEPKELYDFWKPCEHNGDCLACEHFSSQQFEDGTGFAYCEVEQSRRLSRPPQSWCYVDEVG